MSAFIDEYRARFGVEPICRVLGVSASAYYHRATGARSARVVEDERLLERIREVHAANYYAYGYRRTWKALLRAGEPVGRDHVRRLMQAHGICGAKRRGKPWRTTIPDPSARRSPDLVNRQFVADAPDRLWVTDFTYLRCREGLVFFSVGVSEDLCRRDRTGALCLRRTRIAASRWRRSRIAPAGSGASLEDERSSPPARAAERLEQVADRAAKVCEQITRRVAGQKITDRLVSMSDPDARPIRKGKLRQPTEFGTVIQVAELCENTRRGARGLILPVATQIGSPNEHDLVAQTGERLDQLGLRPRELALDGGFQLGPVEQHLPPPDRTFIAGRRSAGSRKTNRRLAKFRVGAEGRISHLKRRYGMRRSRLKGHEGARTTAAWAILAYNLDTLAIRAA